MISTGQTPDATRLVIQRDAAERLAHLPHAAIGHILTDLLFWFMGANPERPRYPEMLFQLQGDQRRSLNRWNACRANGARAARRTTREGKDGEE